MKDEPLISTTTSNTFVYIAFFFPACAGFLFGYDIGAASGAVESIKSLVSVSTVMNSLLTSSSLIGATVGSIIVFWAGEPLGRRRELLLGASFYLIGSVLSIWPPASVALAFTNLGRAIYGLGIAFSMHSAPVYISEMAPANIRGMLVSAKEGFIVGGILIGFAVSAICDAAFSDQGSVFRVIWGVPLFFGVVIISGMLVMPPSPRWLMLKANTNTDPVVSQSYRDAATAALTKFRRGATPEMIEAEVYEIEQSLVQEISTEKSSGWSEMFKARRALIAGLGLISLQQLTGQPSVLYYQTAIFKAAGFGSFASSASVIVSGAKLIATLFTVRYIDNFGRRPLLFAGISMMLAALIVLFVGFYLSTTDGDDENGDPVISLPHGWPPAIIFALVLYVSGYQVGFGPIAWLIISEVFPLHLRTRALSAAVTVNFGFNLLMTFTLKPLQEAFNSLQPGKGQSYLFLLYSVLTVASIFFTYFFVPETKGKSLEEIQALLQSKPRARVDIENSLN